MKALVIFPTSLTPVFIRNYFRFFCVCWVLASPQLTRCLRGLCWAEDEVATVTTTTARVTTTLSARDSDKGLAAEDLVLGGRDVTGSMTLTMTLSTTLTTPSELYLMAISPRRLMTTMTWLDTTGLQKAKPCLATTERRGR